jgi:hypothetical protein
MEIYRWLSVMWRVDGNIEEAECDVESGWKYIGIIFIE